MANARDIVREIDKYLDKAMLKKSNITSDDLIAFIEEKWAMADDEKYDIDICRIICVRMVNEYARKQDFENMMRWISMSELVRTRVILAEFIHNYYIGTCCYKCGAKEEALKYFKLSYDENPESILRGDKEYIKFFSENTGIKLEVEEKEEKKFYSANVSLPAWKEFFGEDAKEIEYDLGGDEPKCRMSKNHKNGLNYLIENEEKILNVILDELFKNYPQLQEDYDYDEDEKEDYMPDVKEKKEFANLISPIGIHIMSVQKNGMPYIGYDFSCSWDSEHALGFMMFEDRVVEMGGADTSLLSWIAEADLKKHSKNK